MSACFQEFSSQRIHRVHRAGCLPLADLPGGLARAPRPGSMTAVAHHGIAHSQLFKQAPRPRLEPLLRSGREALNARNGVACCSCKKARSNMQGARSRGSVRLQAEPGTKDLPKRPDIENPRISSEDQGDAMDLDEDSESAQKQAEIERLRQAEKFMVVGTGEATCMGCGYEYQPKNGDPEYPITPGTYFSGLPEDWLCPICSADKSKFQAKAKEVAGFAENQKYGLGTNSLTGGQKSLLIFGSLFAFFFLFLAGYFIQ